jgi:hypothetical protein
MLYAILAYHEEGVVESWTKEEDAALMANCQVNDRLVGRSAWARPHGSPDAARRDGARALA